MVASLPPGDPGRGCELRGGVSQAPVYCHPFFSNSPLDQTQSNNKGWKCLSPFNYQVPEFVQIAYSFPSPVSLLSRRRSLIRCHGVNCFGVSDAGSHRSWLDDSPVCKGPSSHHPVSSLEAARRKMLSNCPRYQPQDPGGDADGHLEATARELTIVLDQGWGSDSSG